MVTLSKSLRLPTIRLLVIDTQLAVVTSIVNFENQHLDEISKKVQSFISAKNVRLKTIIDPSLIAGFTTLYKIHP